MSAPSPASNTTANVAQTQTSEMDPKLYALLYGSNTAPGSLVLANASNNAQMMQGVQNQDPAALQKFFGYSPSSSDIDAAGSRTYAAEGGEVKERGFASGGASTVLDPATAMIGVTPYFDPTTGSSTNPYFNQAVQSLNTMPTSSPELQQAADLYGAAGRNAGLQWTQPGVSQMYMDPYIQNVLQSQLAINNQQNQSELNALNAQSTQQGAYGGARQGIEAQQMQFNQNLANQNLVAQGLSGAYQSGMGQFNAGQQNALNAVQGLAGTGTAKQAYGTQQAQNWGAAGQTLQNLAQQYFNTNQQSAQNIWGGVGTAAAPGIAAVSGQPWGGVSTSTTTSSPSYWGKKTGGTVAKRGGK